MSDISQGLIWAKKYHETCTRSWVKFRGISENEQLRN